MNAISPPRPRKLIDYYYDYAALLTALGALLTGLIPWLVLKQGPAQDKYLWSLHRHDWISLHLAFALTFTAIAVIHLVRHWRWVRVMTPRHVSLRKGLGGLAVFTSTTALVGLLVWGIYLGLSRNNVTQGRGQGWRGGRFEAVSQFQGDYESDTCLGDGEGGRGQGRRHRGGRGMSQTRASADQH